jgi:DNA replication protein DnaC
MSRPVLLTALKTLNLYALASNLDDFLARATKQRLSPEQLVEEFVRTETIERERRSMERRLRKSKVGTFKPMADFDWNWPKKIDRPAVERALAGDIVTQRENLILVAAQGLGKTMIAKNIVHQTVMGGRSARFVEAPAMLLDLSSQESPAALERRLRRYARPDILCIDEVGYLSYDSRAADLLFQVVSRRYEQKSTIITTNLAFKDWASVFPNASCTTALIDRLTHHAEIVLIEGDSYRKREAEEAKVRRQSARTSRKTR